MRAYVCTPEKNRRAGDARIRQADFYVPVATGIFKSAAEIAFLEAASRQRLEKEASFSSLVFPQSSLPAILPSRSYRQKILDSFAEFPRHFLLNERASERAPIVRDKRETIVSIAYDESRAERIWTRRRLFLSAGTCKSLSFVR